MQRGMSSEARYGPGLWPRGEKWTKLILRLTEQDGVCSGGHQAAEGTGNPKLTVGGAGRRWVSPCQLPTPVRQNERQSLSSVRGGKCVGHAWSEIRQKQTAVGYLE